ncbi:MAG: response regulator [Desulfovibrionaceae bacterium]|nr:response regulator [Desulfovibrionaceae bacterium]
MKRNAILSAACLLLCLWAVPALAEKPSKSVLYLNSYHHGYQWSDSIMDGVRSVLAGSQYKIDLQIEYMDAKRYNYKDVTGMLLRLYKEKFVHERFDIIITSDNDAFSFASQYREILFPGVPLVFCGVNDLNPRAMTQGNMTGVVEQFDLSRTLDVVMRLHPGKNHMIVVGDSSTAGNAIRHQIETIVPQYNKPLTVEYWINLSLDTVLARVETLPDNSFLFFIPYYQVIDGRFLTSEEVMESIYARSSVPIYTTWAFLLGHGAVGGKMLSGFKHGQTAASLALEVLDGKRPDDIPVYMETTGEYRFDYAVMERLHLDMDRLPEGSTIINAPKAFYELPKELFWTIIVSLALLCMVVVFLILTIVERRRVEQKVKDQLAFQEILMDTVPQLVSWKDRRGRYLGSNHAFAEFFGCERAEAVMGKTAREVMRDPDYVAWSMDADQSVLYQHKAVRKVRRELADAQGEPAWVEVNKVPISDRSGQVVGVLSTAENITKERNLEKQLLQSQKMEAIGTLAGGIAHDFNNILTSIINSTELAVSDIDPESMTNKDLERVLKAARRGGRVVKQILAFSRPSTEGFRPTDVGAVVSEALALMESSMPGNIEVRSRIADNIPCVLADPTQIHQTAMNLCTNSFHALRSTGGIIEVGVDVAELEKDDADLLGLAPGEYVHLVFEDNGPGIQADILDKIFDPFFTTKDKTEGTGLGLAVVHGIVRSHKGGLRVTPRPGGGTVFTIYLPKSAGLSFDCAANTGDTPAFGIHVLFVEDDADQLATTPRLLEAMGCRVTPLGVPEEALELTADNGGTFDLVITDYDMPGLSGTQLAERLARFAPDLPIILISGREDAAGAAAHLPNIRRVIIKPYDKHDLSEAIRSVLPNA